MERTDDEREVETDRSGEAGKVDEEATTGGKWPYRGQEQREQQRGRKRREKEPGSG